MRQLKRPLKYFFHTPLPSPPRSSRVSLSRGNPIRTRVGRPPLLGCRNASYLGRSRWRRPVVESDGRRALKSPGEIAPSPKKINREPPHAVTSDCSRPMQMRRGCVRTHCSVLSSRASYYYTLSVSYFNFT